MKLVLKTQKTCSRCQAQNLMIRLIQPHAGHEGAYSFIDITGPAFDLEDLMELAQKFPEMAPKNNGRGWGSFCVKCHAALPVWDFSDLEGHPLNGLMLSHWQPQGPHLIVRTGMDSLSYLEKY